MVGAAAYLYLINKTIQGTGEGLSFATFILWCSLASLISFLMYKKGANPAVPVVYGCGAGTTALILLIKGRYAWSNFDIFIGVLVVLTVLVWLTSGPRVALVMSVAAGIIAGVPFVLMTWQTPLASPIISNVGFLIANILSFASAKAWTLEDRLFSGANALMCMLLVEPWVMAQW